MKIAIRTRHLSLRPRLRARLESYLRTVLQQDQEHLAMATLYITATPLAAGSLTGFSCRLVLDSVRAGQIVVSSEAPRLTTALRHATRRGRAVVRQRSKQSLDRSHGVRAMRQQLSPLRVEQCSS